MTIVEREPGQVEKNGSTRQHFSGWKLDGTRQHFRSWKLDLFGSTFALTNHKKSMFNAEICVGHTPLHV